MEQDKHIQITFMPWAPLDKEIKMGPISFLPFSSAAQRIPDAAIQKHLADYFKCYVNPEDLSPVDTIMLCSHGDNPIRVLSDVEKNEITKAIDALVFCAIGTQNMTSVSANARSWVPPTSDAFETYTQNLHPETEHFSVTVGSMKHIVKFGATCFTKPWSTGGTTFTLSNHLVVAFDKLLAPSNGDADFRDRVFRSLEWFRLANTEGGNVSPFSKVVMMATAFEIILDIGSGSEKKLTMAYRLEEICGCKDSLRETRKIGMKQLEHTFAKVAWWGYDFYNLRNSIVHGTPVTTRDLMYADPWPNHLIVANLVFYECALRKLLQRGYMEDICHKAIECAKIMNAGEDFKVLLQLPFNIAFSPNGYKERLGWVIKRESGGSTKSGQQDAG
jgi:hypothetical protein